MLTHPASGRMIAENVHFLSSPLERSKGMLIYKTAPSSMAAVFRLALGGFFPLVHTFGMKFPIDIVFCDAGKKVRHIYLSVKPGRLVMPIENILGGCPYLLEFSECNLHGIQVGDQLEW